MRPSARLAPLGAPLSSTRHLWPRLAPPGGLSHRTSHESNAFLLILILADLFNISPNVHFLPLGMNKATVIAKDCQSPLSLQQRPASPASGAGRDTPIFRSIKQDAVLIIT